MNYYFLQIWSQVGIFKIFLKADRKKKHITNIVIKLSKASKIYDKYSLKDIKNFTTSFGKSIVYRTLKLKKNF